MLCQPAVENLHQPSEKANRLRTPVFCETISDNGLLCQREIGLQAELDVASIWERVSHLDTSITVSDKDLRIMAQAGGQAFDVLICIKHSPSRVTRCRNGPLLALPAQGTADDHRFQRIDPHHHCHVESRGTMRPIMYSWLASQARTLSLNPSHINTSKA